MVRDHQLAFWGMVLMLLTGIPIAFAFLIVNMVAAYFSWGIPALSGCNRRLHVHYDLYPAPGTLFHSDGELIFHSGSASMLWAYSINGSANSRAGSLFSPSLWGHHRALSGSTIATCALLGTILLPQMLEKGYSKNMSLGPLMG